MYVVRSKKGRIVRVYRDSEPVKEVKGGGGVTDKSKPTTGNIGTTGSY
jgi:hypothetical protein